MPGLTETSGTIDLEIFWQLASSSPEERVAAAKKLTISLAAAEKAHEGEGPSSDLSYSLKRLIRGLASSRDGAREGFCLALVQVLRTRHEIEPLDVFKQVIDLLQVPKGGTTQEEKECHFGRLFGCKALVQANITAISEKDSKRILKHGGCEDLVAWKVLEELIRLQKLKSYLSEGCHCTLVQLVETVPDALFVAAFAPRLEKLYAETSIEARHSFYLILFHCILHSHPTLSYARSPTHMHALPHPHRPLGRRKAHPGSFPSTHTLTPYLNEIDDHNYNDVTIMIM